MMHSLTLTSGPFAVPALSRAAARARAGRVVPIETMQTASGWRMRRGCGQAFEVYGTGGEFLGQVVAPSDPGAPGFGGGTVYLDRTHLAVVRD